MQTKPFLERDSFTCSEKFFRRLALLLNLAKDAIFVRDLNARVTCWNLGAQCLYGWSREEALGKQAHILLQTIFYEKEYVRRDGRRVPVLLADAILPGPEEQIAAFALDLTDRKLAEGRLPESEKASRIVAELVSQLVWICQADGMCVYFNQRWVDYTGLTLEESYGKGWNTPFPPELLEQEEQIRARVQRGERVENYETLRRHKNGRLVDVSLTISPIKDGAGHRIGTSTIARDVTESRRTAIRALCWRTMARRSTRRADAC